MAKEYNVGDRLYLPVWVTEKETNLMMGPDKSTTITDAKFSYAYWHGKTGEGKVRYGEPGLLLTAEEVSENVDTIARSTLDEYSEKAQRKIEALTKQLEEANETIKAFSESEDIVRTNFDAKVDENKELKSRNAELEALLKEVMATRDEAIRQNNELIAERNNWHEAAQRYHDNAKVADAAADNLRKENGELKAKAAENADTISRLSANKVALTEEVGRLRETVADRTIDVQHLAEENVKLKADLDQRNKDFDAMKKDRDNILADSKRTTEWYSEANRTASEAAEANDDLKAKIADLRNRVGEQLAQIQDLNAEVHFHKEFGEGLDKQQKELQARYDELDSVNKEQAEKIRKLDKALADLKQRNDKLQDENTNLTFLLEDAPEKETTKTLHVVLNDGTEIEFRRYTAYDYRTDINMFVVKDGERYIAGFLRGDKPMNLAYWWTE